jgi:pimeloyl-ACP methyl ester carboxylesterase
MSTATLNLQTSTLKVPGAQLYYEMQGTGPVLLMIPGGPTDAGIFASLAKCLVDRYTVVRYDPRGNSRSVLDGPAEDQDMDVHGDDAAALLEALTAEPAYVLGSSGGAQIGLNLAARHPERVRTLVAHEAPCMALLPDPLEQLAFGHDVYNTYITEGAGPAMQKFTVGAGLSGPPVQRTAPPSPEEMEAFARVKGNIDYFLGHGFIPIGSYIPNVAVLRAGPAPIVIGVGESSTGSLPFRTAVVLADQLGIAPVVFPGGHGGYNDYPDAFAERLHETLRGSHVTPTHL